MTQAAKTKWNTLS